MSTMLNTTIKPNVGTTPVEVYKTPAAKSAVCLAANVANLIDQTIYVDIKYKKAGLEVFLIKGVFIPPNCAYIWSGAEQKIVLDENDSFIIKSSSDNSCDVVVSVSEIS